MPFSLSGIGSAIGGFLGSKGGAAAIGGAVGAAGGFAAGRMTGRGAQRIVVGRRHGYLITQDPRMAGTSKGMSFIKVVKPSKYHRRSGASAAKVAEQLVRLAKK